MAWSVSALPCGCYRRDGDGQWFYMDGCPMPGHTHRKDASVTRYKLPSGVYR